MMPSECWGALFWALTQFHGAQQSPPAIPHDENKLHIIQMQNEKKETEKQD